MQVGSVTSNVSQSVGAVYSGDFTNPVLYSVTGYEQVFLNATDGTQQVGGGFLNGAVFPQGSDNPYRALVFSGSAASFVDLTPTGAYSALANAVDGGQQGGFVEVSLGSPRHPALWAGTAASFKDLLPSGALQGNVRDIKNGVQAGSVQPSGSADTIRHAAIWSGSLATFVDKNPSGYQYSSIAAIVKGGFVGVGLPNGVTIGSDSISYLLHALLWTGNKVVDLNPAGKEASAALAGSGTMQVGLYYDPIGANGFPHACMWKGSATSFVDLQSYLPGIYPYSEAHSVVGNKIYGYAYDSSLDNAVAVEWTLS